MWCWKIQMPVIEYSAINLWVGFEKIGSDSSISLRKSDFWIKKCYQTWSIFIKAPQVRKQHWMKSVRIWSFCGSYFLAFGLNRERYCISLHIQSECGKIRTRKTPNTDTFYSVQKGKVSRGREGFVELLSHYHTNRNKMSENSFIKVYWIWHGFEEECNLLKTKNKNIDHQLAENLTFVFPF